MDGVSVAQLVVSTVAATMVAAPLVVIAYLAGRRSLSPEKSRRLDQLLPDVTLDGTVWQATFDGDADPEVTQTIQFAFTQVGSRVVADGHSPDGTHHALEGVIHGGRLCCVTIDESRSGIWLGTVTAELIGDHNRMTGMRTRWSPVTQSLMVRKAVFTQLHSTVSSSERTVSH